jgi:hypothetical protein
VAEITVLAATDERPLVLQAGSNATKISIRSIGGDFLGW